MNARLQPTRPLRWGAVLALLVGVMVSACGSVQPELMGSSAVAEEPLTTQASVVALGAVIINEVGLGRDPGPASVWIELYNPGNLSVDLAGFGLSNSAAEPFRWTFPAGATIEPGQGLRVWLPSGMVGAALHADFSGVADPATDRAVVPVLLSAPNGVAEGLLLDRTIARFGGVDASWCRTPNGDAAGAFHKCARLDTMTTSAAVAQLAQ